MIQLLCFSSLVGLALSKCFIPAPKGVTPASKWEMLQRTDGSWMYYCSVGVPFGRFGPTGPMAYEPAEYHMCHPAIGKFFVEDTNQETKLTSMVCANPPLDKIYCSYAILPEDAPYVLAQGDTAYCPNGYTELEGREVISMTCNKYKEFYVKLSDGNTITRLNPSIACDRGLTMTTTTWRPLTTATSTRPGDLPPTADQLWDVTAYYSFDHGVHAFCADQICLYTIQSNGIGYDMFSGKELIGRSVSQWMIGSVRASCPYGSLNLRNLGFTKSDNAYVHNLNGTGLKQGWVSIYPGACGATVPIKSWTSRYSDDVMYAVDKETNPWYKDRVQNGGNPHFYMWP